MLCFFNLAGAACDRDVDGMDIESRAAARLAAAGHIGEVIRDAPALVWDGEKVRVEVIDENRAGLCTIMIPGSGGTPVEVDATHFGNQKGQLKRSGGGAHETASRVQTAPRG